MTPEQLGVTADLGTPGWVVRALVSAGVIVAIALIRWGLQRYIRSRGHILTERQRWWLAAVRNTASGLIVLLLLLIWAPEIEAFALSITAFAVALVIATKELILCVSGAVWRSAARPFSIGDWVEIGGHSGEVIDETLLVTDLQEIDRAEFRYTGRTIAVPNAMLLSAPVVNHNFRKNFILHEFTIHSEPNPKAAEVRDAVTAALTQAMASFGETARRYAGVIERRAGVKLPDTAPAVRLGTNEFGKIAYRVAIFCPRERVVEMEQIAMLAWLSAGGARPVGQ
jgi:small-conductance mechanosensitive channel